MTLPHRWKKFDESYNRFDTMPAFYRETDRQTDRTVKQYRALHASAYRRAIKTRRTQQKPRQLVRQYDRGQTEPGLVAFYDIRPQNGSSHSFNPVLEF